MITNISIVVVGDLKDPKNLPQIIAEAQPDISEEEWISLCKLIIKNMSIETGFDFTNIDELLKEK